ncbi:MAG: hypothetical protein ACU841_03090 [Gammaproteobacteria bacterium]
MNVTCETTKQVLERIASQNGWNSNDEIVLSNTSIEKLYELFKSEKERHRLLSLTITFIKFGHFLNASDPQKRIANNATEALKKIAMESTINKLRVRKYGVEIEDE